MDHSKKLIVSKYLLPVTSKAIKAGCLVVDSKKILAMGSYSVLKRDYPSLPEEDYSDSIILPGFVNAHTHLELGSLRNKVPYSGSFVGWIRSLGLAKRHFNEPDIIQAVIDGANELWDSGVVAVGDISSEYISRRALSQHPMSGKVYWEYISPSPDAVMPRLRALTESMTDDNLSHTGIEDGISPHSPYTLCPQAFAAINSLATESNLSQAIHVGESQSEKDFFQSRTGELFDFIHSFYPVTNKINGTSPLAYLQAEGYLSPETLIIHLNILEDHEIDILQNLSLSVVHCPGSHEFFSHPEFQMKKLVDSHVNVCLGTDSLASTDNLNFFQELRRIKNNYPFLSGDIIIRMATIHGAKALKLDSGLGELSVAKHYNMIAIPGHSQTEPLEEVIYHNGPVKHIKSAQ